MKIRITKPFKKEGIYYSDIREAVNHLFELESNEGKPKGDDSKKTKPKEDKPKKNNKKPINQVPGVPNSIKPVFPMDFILRKFPELKVVLDELLTVTFKDYIENIFVVAPKPTTFKVLLKNEQSFLLVYMERSWVVKASGKKYYMLNISEKERAIQAIADLLITKNFISSKNSEKENQSTGPEITSSEKGGKHSSSGGGGGPSSTDDFSSDELDSILAGENGGESEGEPEGESEPTTDNEPISENFILRIKK